MIQLDVESYCHNCAAFEPFKYDMTTCHESFNLEMVEETITYVRCENYKRCRAIARYIRKELESADSRPDD